MNHIDCVGLVVVQNRKLLLAFSRNKQAWYLPGGKIDAGETALAALQREINEELNIFIAAESLQWYCHITAPAFGEVNLVMEQECFLHQLTQIPVPSSEIGDIRYFDLDTYRKEEHQVPGVLIVFEKLRQDGWVD